MATKSISELFSIPVYKLSKSELISLVDFYQDENMRLEKIVEKLGYTRRVLETHGVLAVN